MKTEISTAVAGAIGGAAAVIAIFFVVVGTKLLPLGPAFDQHVHDYLIAHPQVLVAMTDKLQQQQNEDSDAARQKAADKLGRETFFDPRVAFVIGRPDARTTFVEFFDYNCPYCRASLDTVKKFYAAHRNDARFAFIEFPIKGQDSIVAARAAIAARKQPDKYLDFHFRLMGEKDLVTEDTVYSDAAKAGLDVAKLKADMADPAVDAAIQAAHNLASAASIDGTPAFIVNGRVHEGAMDDKVLADLMRGGR
jgi:protein-disulfide isomerase